MKMKKILLPILGLLLTAGTTIAQDQGSIRVGAGIVYGSKAGVDGSGSEKGGYGIGIGAEYFLTDEISVAPGFTYFLKSEIAGKNAWGTSTGSVQYSVIDVDGRYHVKTGVFSFYGLAGISSVRAKVRSSADGEHGSFTSNDKTRDTGINIGAGTTYRLNDLLNLNGQLKYNTPMKQIALQLGVGFVIK